MCHKGVKGAQAESKISGRKEGRCQGRQKVTEIWSGSNRSGKIEGMGGLGGTPPEEENITSSREKKEKWG